MSNAPEEISSLAGNIQPSNPVPAKRGVYRRSLSLEQSQNIKEIEVNYLFIIKIYIHYLHIH